MGFLTDLKIRTLSPSAKEQMLNDGDGLYLRVRASSKSWLYRYKSGTKQIKIGLGAYPTITLAMARELTREANTLRAQGIDPQDARREQQEQAKIAKMNTFELMARAWLESASKDRVWSAGYKSKVTRHLEIHVFPWVGDKAMETIRPLEIVRCLHCIKDRGNLETAQRVREAVQHVYQHAVDTGVLEPAQNFVNNRTGGLPTPRGRHYVAITDPQLLGQLLRDMRAYSGNFISVAALRLAPLVFQRPGQLRLAHWEDVDLKKGLWRCPPENMKMREWQKRDSRTLRISCPYHARLDGFWRIYYPLPALPAQCSPTWPGALISHAISAKTRSTRLCARWGTTPRNRSRATAFGPLLAR